MLVCVYWKRVREGWKDFFFCQQVVTRGKPFRMGLHGVLPAERSTRARSLSMDDFVQVFGASATSACWTREELQAGAFDFLKKIQVRGAHVEFEPCGTFGNWAPWWALWSATPAIFPFELRFDEHRGTSCRYELCAASAWDQQWAFAPALSLLLLCDAAYTHTLHDGCAKMKRRVRAAHRNYSHSAAYAARELEALCERLQTANKEGFLQTSRAP